MAYLGKPKKVLGDGGGAALDLHQRDLIFTRHQNVFLVVEYSRQVHTPDENNIKQHKTHKTVSSDENINIQTQHNIKYRPNQTLI